MQTRLAGIMQTRPEAQEVENILRDCVHCGFCLATCPTYQLLGDERDSPRGRIYLLKQVMEGSRPTRLTQQHLDRCLTCRACETTCPSGVRYGRLLDIGRDIVDREVTRSKSEQFRRWLISHLFPYPKRFALLMLIVRLFRPFLPVNLKKKIPIKQREEAWPEERHKRKILLLSGCVQPSLAPSIDRSAALVLDKLGISLLKPDISNCCGALNYHLSGHQRALAFARQNIDACWPYIEQGIEAILMTSSGCGIMIKQYAEILQFDPEYAEKSVMISALTKDLSEVLETEDLTRLRSKRVKTVAFHSPCTLQHGQQITGVVENILCQAGYNLIEVLDATSCCGSAGVYSLLQPGLSRQLLIDKLANLQSGKPDIIATANIGCLTHLLMGSKIKVVHWVELLS